MREAPVGSASGSPSRSLLRTPALLIFDHVYLIENAALAAEDVPA